MMTKFDNRQLQMNTQILTDTAKAMVADDKGLLAMDESNPTCNKRFAKLGISQTVEARRDYRELIVTAPGLGECISGVILYDETIRQQKKMALLCSKSSPMRESFPASKWILEPRTWPGIPARKSPKVWTACATASRNIFKWVRVLPNGVR
jgi:hypothetical protein